MNIASKLKIAIARRVINIQNQTLLRKVFLLDFALVGVLDFDLFFAIIFFDFHYSVSSSALITWKIKAIKINNQNQTYL